MAKKDNGNGQWREVGSDYDGCFEVLGCLVELAGFGVGCMVPTILFAVLVFGVGTKAKPIQRIGSQMVARVQKLRNRPGKRVRLSSISQANLREFTFG